MSVDSEDDKTRDPDWQRRLVQDLATDALRERRRTRRWGIFFKLLTFAYLGVLLFLLIPRDWSDAAMGKSGEHTALVELDGVIAPDSKASADNVVSGLRDAFEHKKTKAVVLRINSPGGSPVQSSNIHTEILRLRAEYPDTPLYAVVSDMCASGGYYVASAADAIYVNESSIVGSIGVLMNGFGFVDAIDDLGIERRLMTAGEHKGLLDPFSPVEDFEKEHVADLLDDIHGVFIEAVKVGRGDRLKASDDVLFNGLFWDGRTSIALGLADEIGSASYVAREVVGAEDLVDFTSKDDALTRLADRFGAALARGLTQVMAARPSLLAP
jgi:protease IV